MSTDFTQKVHLGNFPCPRCSTSGKGSSAAKYSLPDGQEFWSCFESGCPTKGKPQFNSEERTPRGDNIQTDAYRRQTATREEVNTYPFRDLITRGITEETAKRFGIRVSMNSMTNEVDTHYFPYYIKKELAGYKVRRLPKQFMSDVGSISGVDPFGWQNLKPAKKLIITEGEYDACIVYQVLAEHAAERGYKTTPQVVSLPNGAKSVKALLKAHAKTLSTYSELILCFDEDEEGQKAISDFTVAYENPVKVIKLSYKDANDAYLEEGPQPIIDAFYAAKEPGAGGMVKLRDCFDSIYEEEEQGMSYPWSQMTSQSGGAQVPEIFILMAASGGGKTDIVLDIARHFALEHKEKVAIYSLEMSLRKSAKRIIGKQVQRKKLYEATPEEQEQDRLRSEPILDNISFYDIKQGLPNANEVISLLRQNSVIEGTKIHIIDNLTQLTAGDRNEKTAIDEFIKNLKSVAESNDLFIILVVHLNRGTQHAGGFEAGAMVTPQHLYGSGGPGKAADTVLALERNQYHSDPEIRNTTICRWLKGRDEDNSPVGKVFALKYDEETGNISPTKPVEIIEKQDEGEF